MNKGYGYKAWQKNFERHINKGEKAIRILAPAPYKINSSSAYVSGLFDAEEITYPNVS